MEPATGNSATKSISPRVVAGAVIGLLLAVIFAIVVITLSAKSGTPTGNQVTKADESAAARAIAARQLAQEEMEREEQARLAEAARLANETVEQERERGFERAKDILLNSLSNVGGTPEENVKRGIELLTQYLAHPDARNQPAAHKLLEHAKLAISDEKAVQFLGWLDEYSRKQFANATESASVVPEDMVIVDQRHIEALSPGFSSRFDTKTAPTDGSEVCVFVCGRLYAGGGKYHGSIETAFYDTVAKSAKLLERRLALHVAQETADRKAAQLAKERDAELQNGTNQFKRIMAFPEKYEFGHFYFEGYFGSSIGNIERVLGENFFTAHFSCQTEIVFTSPILDADRILFLVPETLGDKLLDLQNRNYPVRLFCRIKYLAPDKKAYPVAVIYKIEFFESSKYDGPPKITMVQ